MKRAHRIQTRLLVLIAEKIGASEDEIQRALDEYDLYNRSAPAPEPEPVVLQKYPPLKLPEEPQGLSALFDLPDPKPRKRGPYKKRVKV